MFLFKEGRWTVFAIALALAYYFPGLLILYLMLGLGSYYFYK
jgi:hypothetical protein